MTGANGQNSDNGPLHVVQHSYICRSTKFWSQISCINPLIFSDDL